MRQVILPLLGAALLSASCSSQPAIASDDAPPAAPAAAAAPARSATAFTYDGAMTQGGWLRGQVPLGTVSARLDEQALELDADGNFFAAFDRDSGGSAELVATLANGSTVTTPLTVSPRDWQIENINAARTPGGASDAFMRRRQPELDAIWNARTADSSSDGWTQPFIWPATGRISGRFGSQRVYRGEPGAYHSGIDIAAGAGAVFVAPADGVVTLAAREPFSLEGHLIIIDHGAGLNSAFLHSSEILVEEGQVVHQGDPIGRVGASGRATGPHLHWSMKWHNSRLDPILFTGPMP